MGAAVQGGIERERLQFNEKTLWTGGPAEGRAYDYGWPEKNQSAALEAVQAQLAEQGALSPEAVAEALGRRSEEHTSELQSRGHLVCRLLLEKKKANDKRQAAPPRPARPCTTLRTPPDRPSCERTRPTTHGPISVNRPTGRTQSRCSERRRPL